MWENFYQLIRLNLTEVLPPLFWAALLLLIGILISKLIGSMAAAFLRRIRLDQILRKLGLEDALSKIDTRLNAPDFFGGVIKWFFIILFSMVSFGILGLSELSQFLGEVISYFPNIFVAILIFLVAVFLSDFSQKIVIGTLEKEKITYSRFVGRMARWLIWGFAILAILYQLQITPNLILAVFIGMVATISLVLGIAFGLGGKDLAAKILKELEEKFK